jgi:hypothetical protein
MLYVKNVLTVKIKKKIIHANSTLEVTRLPHKMYLYRKENKIYAS